MKINVIITESVVYASYGTTICYKKQFENEDEKQICINEAKSYAFSYGLSFGKVFLNCFENFSFKYDEDIFKYLEDNK